MNKSTYFDLTNQDIENLRIERVDNFDCELKDDSQIYDGFIIAKSPTGSVLTVCDSSFHKSDTDDKYQPRLIFRKSNENFENKTTRSDATHIRIPFLTGQDGYREFWKMISFLYRFKDLIDVGHFEDSFQVVVTDQNSAHYISELLEKGYSKGVWQALVEVDPDLATKLSLSRIYESRKSVIEEMKTKISQDENEEYWQKLLAKNRWIFGNSYIGIIGERRTNISSTLDHPLITEDGYLEIVEIKKPSFSFWKLKTNGEQYLYRDKYLVPHQELQNAITQGSNYIFETEKEMDRKSWAESHDGIYPLKPKCLIIHGRSNDWGDNESQSYRLLNDRLHGVSIITFDHLILRAKQTLELFKPE
ncbi:MAG: Shedu anti-phage system protein SduA domain-containing protein [Candidatus Shapirobacteria bacterium]